jgi:tRNA threonylcarbamoyl adenosine modification protein YeaZ
LLLAIDTASRLISLALHDGCRLNFEATWHTANNHTIELAPAIQRALAQTQITAADLTAVAVSQGPGSFTGLRIGLGMAKGLAMAQPIALVAVPTLDILAAGIPPLRGARRGSSGRAGPDLRAALSLAGRSLDPGRTGSDHHLGAADRGCRARHRVCR